MPGEAVTGKKCLRQEQSVNHMILFPCNVSASGNEEVKDVIYSTVISMEPIYKALERTSANRNVSSPVAEHLADIMPFITQYYSSTHFWHFTNTLLFPIFPAENQT